MVKPVDDHDVFSEVYRVIGGAAADTTDALTGLGATVGNYVGSKAGLNPMLQGTRLGPMVPQPWASGNRILREAVPFFTPGGQEAIVPRAASAGVRGVLHSAVEPAARNAMLPEKLIPKADPIASAVETPLSRRDVVKGLGAAGVAATVGPKVLGELNRMTPAAAKVTKAAAKAARSVHPKQLHDVWENMWDSGDRSYYWEPPEDLDKVEKLHQRAIAAAKSPDEVAAHQEVLNDIAGYRKWNKENEQAYETAYDVKPDDGHVIQEPLMEQNDDWLSGISSKSLDAAKKIRLPPPKAPKDINKMTSVNRLQQLQHRYEIHMGQEHLSPADKAEAQKIHTAIDDRLGQIWPEHPKYIERTSREFDATHQMDPRDVEDIYRGDPLLDPQGAPGYLVKEARAKFKSKTLREWQDVVSGKGTDHGLGDSEMFRAMHGDVPTAGWHRDFRPFAGDYPKTLDGYIQFKLDLQHMHVMERAHRKVAYEYSKEGVPPVENYLHERKDEPWYLEGYQKRGKEASELMASRLREYEDRNPIPDLRHARADRRNGR